MQKLKHLSTRNIADNKVFENVTSFDRLTDNIIQYGESAGDAASEEYNDRVGEALEVFAEFFLARFGTPSNPRLGIAESAHTSTNKFQTGYDFSFKDLNGEPGHIQVKFRRNPTHKFTREELGTFISMADEENVPSIRRILFTNQEHLVGNNSYGIFHPSYAGGLKQMRVLDRSYMEEFIDRDPSFWADLIANVNFSAQAPDQFKPLYVLRDHQVRMYTASMHHIRVGKLRGRNICATGGGKTEVEFRSIRSMFFEEGANLCVLVAPTIDLLRQHHLYFEQFGFFHKEGVSVVHFRTGDEVRQDDHISYAQMTKEDDFTRVMTNNSGKKVLIFVTYASEENLFNIMRKRGVEASLCVWDEFHHTVRQDIDYRNHLLTLPVKHNLFFSASQKRGRVISSFDEEVYGPVLSDVTYAELRTAGILVPSVVIKPIRINVSGKRMRAIGRSLKKAADREGFDLKDAIVESAASIVAREDLIKLEGHSNIVTFSKSVPICKAIILSDTVKAEMPGCLIQTVHANIPARERKMVYEEVNLSSDSILFQHSVVKEGIDITPFNGEIISRNMDVIGTQQGLGRIVRAHPEDTKALKEGKISLDSPVGWKKYTATVYVIIHSGEMDNFRKFMKDLIVKLQFSGLDDNDYQFGEIVEERSGVSEKNNADVKVLSPLELFEGETLRDYVKALQIQMDEEEMITRIEDKVNKMSIDELCDFSSK